VIEYELQRDERILIIRPQGKLSSEDFEKVAAEVDPFIEEHGSLAGLMVEAESFPGWEDFAGLLAHFRFVREHHRKIARVAMVSGSGVLSVAPRIATHFVAADVRHFPFDKRDAALAWLAGTT